MNSNQLNELEKLKLSEREKLFWKELGKKAEKVGSSVQHAINETLRKCANIADTHVENCAIPFHECGKEIAALIRKEIK